MREIPLFLRRRRKHIALVTVVLLLLSVFYYLRSYYLLAGFPSLVITFLLCGIGVAKFFKRVLPYKDIVSYLTHALILGSLSSTIVLLFLGMLGMNYSNQALLVFFIMFSALNVIYFLVPTKGEDDSQLFRLPKVGVSEIFWLVLILIMFFFLFSLAIERYFPNWDSFTFWAVDAKYIYQNRSLRDSTFDIISNFSYSSLYPLNLFLSYVFFGGIYEQFSSLITVFYAFLSFLLLFDRISVVKSKVVKSLAYLSILVVLHAFLSAQNIIVSQYADVFVAFVVLFYSIVLLSPISEEDYFKRVLLLSFSSLLPYLTKSPYMIFTVLLFILWFLYDLPFLKKVSLKSFINWRFLVSFSAIVVFCLVLYFYQSQFGSSSMFPSVNVTTFILSDYVEYFFDLVKFVSSNYPFIFLLFGALALAFLQKLFEDRRYFFIAILFIILISINIFRYLVGLLSLSSMSLLRYLSISFFLIPLLLSNLSMPGEKRKYTDSMVTLLLFLFGNFLVLLVFFSYKLDFQLDPHTGRYQDFRFQEEYYDFAEEVKSKIRPEAKVMIIARVNNNLIGNNAAVPLFVRYYLSENSTGNRYMLPPEEIGSPIKEFHPDYLLLYEYDNFWENCKDVFTDGKSYLVPRRDFFITKNSCLVLGNVIEINP